MKYLLCRPRGGVNDALNQIESCWRYAEIHNRVLVIDTEYLVNTGISVEFSTLFTPLECNHNVTFKLTSTLLENLNKLNTYPNSCKGRLDKYKTRWDAEYLRLVDRDTGVQLTFDFNINYVEELLVHDQFGGGHIGINCLARLKLTDKFRHDVLYRLAPLIGKKYLAVHVRHTDYQTDYKRFFSEIYDKSINKSLLICTDSIDVISFASVFFDHSEVINLGNPPDTKGISLVTFSAFHSDDVQRYNLMVEAISDLIGMATSSEIIFSSLLAGTFSNASDKLADLAPYAETVRNNPSLNIGINGFSGFALLADQLRNNPVIISQLLDN